MNTLEELAQNRKIKIFEPFAKFLQAREEMYSFEISLLDCYKLAGHACPSMTSAFLCTEEAVKKLYPDNVCIRGDLKVEFGSPLLEGATGPKSNVVSYITGAYAESGFPGLGGTDFRRRNLLSFGVSGLHRSEIRYTRLSNGVSVIVKFDGANALRGVSHGLDFPESWRFEISHILNHSSQALFVR